MLNSVSSLFVLRTKMNAPFAYCAVLNGIIDRIIGKTWSTSDTSWSLRFSETSLYQSEFSFYL